MFYTAFNRLPDKKKKEVLLDMVITGGCYFLHCPNCPVYNTLTCSIEYVKTSSAEIFSDLFGSDKLFEILLNKVTE